MDRNTISLVVCDVDDTIVNHKKDEIEKIKKLANIIEKYKIPFTFATGRPYKFMDDIMEIFSTKYPIVLNNGATILWNEKIVFSESIQFKKIEDILIDAYNKALLISITDDNYGYDDKSNINPIIIPTLSTYKKSFSLKNDINSKSVFNTVLIQDVERKNEEYLKNIQEKILERNFDTITYGKHSLEIIPKNINKATGVAHIVNLLKIPNKVLAIGNAPNDIEMIKNAHIGVAVNNASQRLKNVADYICTSSYSSGVIEALEKYILWKDYACTRKTISPIYF